MATIPINNAFIFFILLLFILFNGYNNVGEENYHPIQKFANDLSVFYDGYSAWGGDFYSVGLLKDKWLK